MPRPRTRTAGNRSPKPCAAGTTSFASGVCATRRPAGARACRGNVHVCVPRNFPLLPEGVRAWFAILAQAQEEQMSFDDAMASLDGTPADDAFWEWHETVETSQRPRQVPRDIADEPQR